MDSSRNQAVLQMIPRVDYNRKRGHLRSHDGNEAQKTRRRPPQKLFDAQAIRYIHIYIYIYVCKHIGVTNRIYSEVFEGI